MRVELEGITKSFGSLLANDLVSLTVNPGEIHCILGENGAGKSTLMNVLFGMIQPDEGEIRIDGRPVSFASPREAISSGIGMVHQHFMLVPVFSVAENAILGFEPVKKRVFLDRGRSRRKVLELSEAHGLAVDPDAIVGDLPVGMQQRVEILKALGHDARLLILDEPTAVLTLQETEALFKIMRSLAASGTSIMFITHKLKEVAAVADRVTVLRRGRVAGEGDPKTLTERELASMIVGRDVQLDVDWGRPKPSKVVLSVKDLTVYDQRGTLAVDGLNLEVRAGEIVSIAGVEGNGQTELVQSLVGLLAPHSGSIELDGRSVNGASPRAMIEMGDGNILEVRTVDGLVLPMSIAENLVLDVYGRKPFASGWRRDLRAIEENARRLVEEFDIRAPSVTSPVATLSGGNQQKVVVARELSRELVLLVASQPTRGLDVGSIEYIHRRIVAARDAGVAVLVVSAELDEVLSLGDRVAVMHRGKVVDVVDPGVGRDHIGLLMTGVQGPELGSPLASSRTNGGATG